MSKYANLRKYELRYSDFDFRDELKISSLLALTQESACASADELGFGYSDLKPRNLGFLVVHTYFELRRPIGLGESLTVETWPLTPRHVIFERDYRVTAGEEEVAVGASRWCLVDLNAFTMLTPDKLGSAHENCPYRTDKSVEVPSWKIPKTENAREARRMIAANSHCDHYFHVNNAQYPDFFLDCFTMDELSSLKIKAFQIAYLRQIKEGAEIVLTRSDNATDSILEAYSGGELCTQFRIFFENK